jgi:universal stress protein E
MIFKNVVIVCNPRTRDGDLIQRAIMLLKDSQAQLTVIDVVKNLPEDIYAFADGNKVRQLQESALLQRKTQLQSFLKPFKSRLRDINVKVMTGDASMEIVKEVVENGRDLVMLTTERQGPIGDRVLGVLSLHLIRRCPCPVWVVKPTGRSRYRSILAAVDFGDAGETASLNIKIIESALSIARQDKCGLHVLHACDFYLESLLKAHPLIPNAEVERIAHEVWKKHREDFNKLLDGFDLKGIKVERHFVKGDAGDLIIDLANRDDMDLVVIGTVNRINRSGICIGSTAERVSYQVDASLLAIKPESFVSPIEVAS